MDRLEQRKELEHKANIARIRKETQDIQWSHDRDAAKVAENQKRQASAERRQQNEGLHHSAVTLTSSSSSASSSSSSSMPTAPLPSSHTTSSTSFSNLGFNHYDREYSSLMYADPVATPPSHSVPNGF